MGGRNSFVFAFVSARNRPGDSQLVFFGKNVFNGEMQIGKSPGEPRNLLFVGIRTYLRAGYVGVVEGMAGGNQFVYQVEFPFIPDFFVEAANSVLVLG